MTKTKRTVWGGVLVTLFACLAIMASALSLIACGDDKEAAKPTAIELETSAVKTDYIKGQTLDLTGLRITIVYGKGNDATRKEVAATECDITPAAGAVLNTNNTSVTVKYNKEDAKLSKSFAIKVHNNVTAVVEAEGSELTKVKYFEGQPISPAGIKFVVSYEDGTSETIDATSDNTVIEPAIMGADTTKVTVKYKEFESASFEYDVEKVNGVFIEAEDGILPTGAVLCKDGFENDEAHKPSGTGYVGDFKADDTKDLRMTFVFNASEEGTGNVAFRMASQYLKKSGGNGNWTPIWIGDVQLNKICDVYVNGVQITVGDDKILPGGGSETGELDGSLWLNWQTVELENVPLIEGRNDIQLKFKEHDYNDCSQDSFNGKFTANIDSIIVTSDTSTISKYALAFDKESVKPTGVHLEVGEDEDGNKVPYFVITGTAYYTGYTAEEAADYLQNWTKQTPKSNNANQFTFSGNILFDFQGNLVTGGNTRTEGYESITFTSAASDKEGAGATDYKGTFTMKVNIASLGLSDGVGKYSTHLDLINGTGANFNFIEGTGEHKKDDLDTSMVSTTPIKVGHNTYTLVYEPWFDKDYGDTDYNQNNRQDHYYGCVGLLIEDKTAVNDIVVTDVTLERGEADNENRVYLTINGTANVVDYTVEDAAEVIISKLSGIAGASDISAIVIKGAEGENDDYAATFTILVDVTDVELGNFGIKLNNAAVTVTSDASVTIGHITYAFVNAEDGGALSLVVSSDASIEFATVALEKGDDGEVFVVLTGTYDNYTEEELQAMVVDIELGERLVKTVDVTVADDGFTAKFDISDLEEYGFYTIHAGLRAIPAGLSTDNTQIAAGKDTVIIPENNKYVLSATNKALGIKVSEAPEFITEVKNEYTAPDGYKSLTIKWGSTSLATNGKEDGDGTGKVGDLGSVNRYVQYTFELKEEGKVVFDWKVCGSNWNADIQGNVGVPDLGANVIIKIDGKLVDVDGIALVPTDKSKWDEWVHFVIDAGTLPAGDHTFRMDVKVKGSVNVEGMYIYSTATVADYKAPEFTLKSSTMEATETAIYYVVVADTKNANESRVRNNVTIDFESTAGGKTNFTGDDLIISFEGDVVTIKVDISALAEGVYVPHFNGKNIFDNKAIDKVTFGGKDYEVKNTVTNWGGWTAYLLNITAAEPTDGNNGGATDGNEGGETDGNEGGETDAE